MKKIQRKADVVILGFGSAGMRAYKAAKRYTENVLIVHDGPFGTTCARSGCMPSKLLIAAGNAAHDARNATVFGVHPRDIFIDEKHVMQRVRDMRDIFVSHVMEDVEKIPEEDRLRGKGYFLDQNTIAVGDDIRIEAKTIVIATGSSPIVPPNFPLGSDRIIVNDQLFEWEELPKSIAIFGTGVIGLELGQALSRLGVKTTIFGRSGNISSFADPVLYTKAAEIFRQELTIYPASNIREMQVETEGIRIRFTDENGHQHDIHYDYVLSAVGRAPNVKEIGLQNTGLKLNERGVPEFDKNTLRCGESNIFIAGDANGFRQLLHEASDEGDIAGANAALYPRIETGKRRVGLGIVFTDPAMASVGQGVAELAAESYVIGEMDFKNQSRAEMLNKNQGLIHVYAAKESGKLLGAEMIGPDAEHLGHLLAWAITEELTVSDLLKMPFYHPTIEEGLRSALQRAAKQIGAEKALPNPEKNRTKK